MFISKKELNAIRETLVKQSVEIKKLQGQLEELSQKASKRYISDTTTQEDAPIPVAQVLDEWLNGGKEDKSNNGK